MHITLSHVITQALIALLACSVYAAGNDSQAVEYHNSFETEASPTDWTVANWEEGFAEVSLRDSDAVEGAGSLRIERTIDAGYSAYSSPDIALPVKKGQAVQISVWAKSTARGAEFRANLKPQSKKFRRSVPQLDEWAPIQFKWIADQDSDTVTLRFFCSGTGIVRFDKLEISVSDADRASLFEEVPYPDDRSSARRSSLPNRDGRVLFTTSPTDKVNPGYLPSESEIIHSDSEVEVSTAVGQYQPVSLGVYSNGYAGTTTLSVSDLVDESGNVLARGAVDIKVMTMMPLRTNISSYEYFVGPKILKRGNSLELSEDQTGQFWLTLKVPPDTKPGFYRGRIIVQSDDEQAAQSVPLRVHVVPYRLVDPPVERFMFSGWMFRDHKDDPEALRAMLEDMKAYGMTTICFQALPELSYAPNGEILVDLDWIDQGMEVYKEVMGGEVIVPSGVAHMGLWISESIVDNIDWSSREHRDIHQHTPLRWRLFEYAYANMVEHFEGLGFTPYMFIYDEAGGAPRRHIAMATIQHAKEIKPETMTATTVSTEFAETLGDDLNVNIFAYYAHDFDPEAAGALSKAGGDQFWGYGQSWSNEDQSANVIRYEAGVYAWKHGFSGMGWWAYRVPVGDPYDDLDGDTQDFMMSYPTDQAPHPTINWEALREGINDLKYLYTLESHVTRLKDTELSAEHSEHPREAEDLLDDIRQSVTVVHPYAVVPSYNDGMLTSKELDAYRQQLAQMIEILSGM